MRKFNTVILSLALSLFWSFTQAASLTDSFENLIVDHLFRGTAYSASTPANYYVGLHTAACGDATNGTEVSTSGTNYGRVPVARSTSAWNGTHGNTTGASSGSNGTISNAAAIDFSAPTGDWTPTNQINWFSLWDSASGGTMLLCSQLANPKSVNNGDAAPSFAPGALTIQIDD